MKPHPYCYPGTNVYRNKFDIRDAKELDEILARIPMSIRGATQAGQNMRGLPTVSALSTMADLKLGAALPRSYHPTQQLHHWRRKPPAGYLGDRCGSVPENMF